MNIDKAIQDSTTLEVAVEDMQALLAESITMYALARRIGLGATDASVYLGVNLYTKVEELIAEKRSSTVTDEEVAVSKKPAVRKGADLEPLILTKFSDFTRLEVSKPKAMYKLKAHPQLTVNFDGVTCIDGQLIPVEAKYVSKYGAKYFDTTKAMQHATDLNNMYISKHYANTKEHIEANAALYGIPAYYYTQVQQQILALSAPFGYLAALFDEPWQLHVFVIPRDETTINAIIRDSAIVWKEVKGTH